MDEIPSQWLHRHACLSREFVPQVLRQRGSVTNWVLHGLRSLSVQVRDLPCALHTSTIDLSSPSRSKSAYTLTKATPPAAVYQAFLHLIYETLLFTLSLALPACKSAWVPAAWTAIVLGGGSAGLLAVVCYLLRQPLVGIFTKDQQVIANAQQIFYVMCYTIFTDGVNVSIEGAAGTCHQSPWLDRLALPGPWCQDDVT